MVQWLYFVAISLLPVGKTLLFEYTAVILAALTAWLEPPAVGESEQPALQRARPAGGTHAFGFAVPIQSR